MNDSLLISVIVPVYKSEKYLKRCVDSILNQTYQNLEIILVDDGSPDNCPQICDKYAEKDSRIRVIHKPNGGLSDARNKGLDIANGNYIAFVDSDDYIATEMYAMMIEAMHGEDVDIVMCARYDEYPDKTIETYFLPQTRVFTHHEAMNLILTDTIGSQSWDKLYKRDVYKDLRFPIGRIYEDIGTTYLAFERCQKFMYIHQPLYYYQMNYNGISFSERPNKIFDTFLSFYERLNFAEEKYPEIIDECLKKTFDTAIGALNYHIRFKFEQEKSNLPIVNQFLYSYKRKILSNPLIPMLRKVLFALYLKYKPAYRFIMSFAIKCKYK